MDSDASTPPDPSIEWCVAAAETKPQTRQVSHKPSRAAAPPSKPSRAPRKLSLVVGLPPKTRRASRKSSRAAAPTRKTNRTSRKPSRAAGSPPKTSRTPRNRVRASAPTRTDGPVCVNVGDRVEVFWDTLGEWYAGEVIDVDKSDETYMVHYFEDNQKH